MLVLRLPNTACKRLQLSTPPAINQPGASRATLYSNDQLLCCLTVYTLPIHAKAFHSNMKPPYLIHISRLPFALSRSTRLFLQLQHVANVLPGDLR